MKAKITYLLIYSGIWLLSLLPFRALYVLSDFMYWWVYCVAGYRKKVVRRNLTRSFPDKTATELRAIERKFYHYLCDYMLEDIKMLRLPAKELYKRMEYYNTEQYLAMTQKYGGIVVMIPHYANYEWLTGMGAIMQPQDIPLQVYKPLKNKQLDALFRHIRSRFGGLNVPKHSTAREIIRLKRAGKKMVVGLITDQWPSGNDGNYWTTFMNQETVFMDGAERIAKMMNFPVFYSELTKDKRGYCRVTFDLLTEHPQQMGEGEITELFARRVEQTILRQPAYWLWSHKRWKHTRAEEEAAKKR